MGSPDILIVRCPACGAKLEFQSKAGPCQCCTYNIHNVPPEIAVELDTDATRCQCGELVRLSVQTIINITAYLDDEEGLSGCTPLHRSAPD